MIFSLPWCARSPLLLRARVPRAKGPGRSPRPLPSERIQPLVPYCGQDDELFIYFLGKQGLVETTNYRTVRLFNEEDMPLYVKDKFGDFYRDLFTQKVKRESEWECF